jgi:hypothetical protein
MSSLYHIRLLEGNANDSKPSRCIRDAHTVQVRFCIFDKHDL